MRKKVEFDQDVHDRSKSNRSRSDMRADYEQFRDDKSLSATSRGQKSYRNFSRKNSAFNLNPDQSVNSNGRDQALATFELQDPPIIHNASAHGSTILPGYDRGIHTSQSSYVDQANIKYQGISYVDTSGLYKSFESRTPTPGMLEPTDSSILH